MEWGIKQIHNISRPGEPPNEGETVEVECVGGFVLAVDPITRKCRTDHQRFQLCSAGRLIPLRRRVTV